MAAAFGDMDLDGDLDLVIANHSDVEWHDVFSGPVDGEPDRLYENDGTGFFTEVSERLPTDTNLAFTYQVGWFDLDGDIYPDLYKNNDFGFAVQPNTAHRNPGAKGGLFADMTAGTGLDATVAGMGMGFGDVNHDGIVDLFLTNFGPVELHESLGNSEWVETAEARGVIPEHELGYYALWGSELADMDNDGELDIYAQTGEWMIGEEMEQNPREQPDFLYMRRGDDFVNESPAWGLDDVGNNRGLVLVDHNRDGYLDVIRRNVVGRVSVMWSRCDDAAWLTVALRAPGPNTYAVGARVEVEVGEVTHTSWLNAGGHSFASGGPFELHFGLAEADAIDALRVVWPDGQTSEFGELSTRQRVEITRSAPW